MRKPDVFLKPWRPRKALELAIQQNDPDLAEALRARIALYEAGQPYRQTKLPLHGPKTK